MVAMEMPEGDAHELVEFRTLLDEDRALLVGRRGATALGFAQLLKFYSRHGRFRDAGPSPRDGDRVRVSAGEIGVHPHCHLDERVRHHDHPAPDGPRG